MIASLGSPSPNRIDPQEITLDPASYIDPHGRVFSWRGEFYRAIVPSAESFFRHLLREIIDPNPRLKEAFVGTEITDLSLDGYALVLRHRTVPYPSYGFEWSPPMLKDAALYTLQILIELTQHDLTLQDAHPWNIFFQGTKPVYIDLGSVVPADARFLWQAYDQFCSFFLFPLYLYGAGLTEVTRPLLQDYIAGVPGEICRKLLPWSYVVRHPRTWGRLIMPQLITALSRRFHADDSVRALSVKAAGRADLSNVRPRFFQALQRDVDTIRLPLRRTPWTVYDRDHDATASGSYPNGKEKVEVIRRVLRQTKPTSLLDVGCNVGRYSILAAEEGIPVIAIDRDVSCVSLLYREAKSRGLPILPLVVDVANPSPSVGWCAKQYPSAIDRFRVECVLALALVHHLAFRQQMDFERIIGALGAFTTRWLVVEFVGRDDPKVLPMLAQTSRDFQWYDLSAFHTSLCRHFRSVEVHELSHPSRHLLVCER